MTKKLVHHKSPLKSEIDTWVKGNKGKAELFPEHLKHTVTPNEGEEADNITYEKVERIPHLSSVEVEITMKQQFSSKKVPG